MILGTPKDPDAFFQNFNNPFAGRLNWLSMPRENLLKMSSKVMNLMHLLFVKASKKEIYSPNMIRISRSGQRQLNYCHFLVLARSVPLQFFY